MKEKMFYSMKHEELFQKLKTSTTGLSTKEASRRLERDGLNELPHKKPDSVLKIFIKELLTLAYTYVNIFMDEGTICISNPESPLLQLGIRVNQSQSERKRLVGCFFV